MAQELAGALQKLRTLRIRHDEPLPTIPCSMENLSLFAEHVCTNEFVTASIIANTLSAYHCMEQLTMIRLQLGA